MVAKLIEAREWERDFLIDDGRIITLKCDADYYEISFWEGENQLGGSADVFYFEELDENPDNKFRLSRMYCPLKGYGLGREAVKMFIELFDAIVVTRAFGEGPFDDGSHLTEDAPGFVIHMQKEKLIEEWYQPDDYDF
ncbi:MAG: hypothetical protein RBR64_01620 [Bacteroidales bacterium]|jgi:hypothetical protein|nr:hypothetical protein [Bacteroidales bacterium]